MSDMLKTIFKNKGGIFIAIFIIAIFFSLHYYIYLDRANDTPIIQSSTEMPAEMKALTLCETKFPSYLNPIQRPSYTYCFNDSEKKISEEAESYFSYSHMRPIYEKISDYWQGEEVEGKMFMRQLVVEDYPNPIFFFIQYALIGIFIFIVFKLFKS